MSVKRLSATAAPAVPEPEMTITDSLQAIYEYVAKEDDFVLAAKNKDNVKPRPAPPDIRIWETTFRGYYASLPDH